MAKKLFVRIFLESEANGSEYLENRDKMFLDTKYITQVQFFTTRYELYYKYSMSLRS